MEIKIILTFAAIVIFLSVICYFFFFNKKKVNFSETNYTPPAIIATLNTSEKFDNYLKKNYIDLLEIDTLYPLINVFGRLVPVNNPDHPNINNKGNLEELLKLKNKFPEALQQFNKLKTEREHELLDIMSAPESVYKPEERQRISLMINDIIISFNEIINYLNSN